MHEPVLGSHWQRTEEPVTHIDSPVPNYLSDLNAMHEAEKHIPEAKREDYVWNLNLLHPSADIHSSDIRRDIRMEVFELVHATAAHRAEAFLKTLGLWRDEA